MRGMIAPRADEATANAPDCTATSARISGTLSSPSRRLHQQRRASPASVPTDDRRYSRRRSTTSAIAPPYRPNTTSGTQPDQADQADLAATSASDAYTCTGTATWVSIEPMNEVPWPISSRRKAGIRSGRVSTACRRSAARRPRASSTGSASSACSSRPARPSRLRRLSRSLTARAARSPTRPAGAPVPQPVVQPVGRPCQNSTYVGAIR